MPMICLKQIESGGCTHPQRRGGEKIGTFLLRRILGKKGGTLSPCGPSASILYFPPERKKHWYLTVGGGSFCSRISVVELLGKTRGEKGGIAGEGGQGFLEGARAIVVPTPRVGAHLHRRWAGR